MVIKEIIGKPDYSEIIDLINTIWPEEFGEKSDEEKICEMEKSFDLTTDTVKYLYKEDKIIGFYRYSLWPREDIKPKSAHTFDIAILPSFQNNGLGKYLMNDLISDCKNKGIEKLLSRTFLTNKGSIFLHKSCGFKEQMKTEDSIVWIIAP